MNLKQRLFNVIKNINSILLIVPMILVLLIVILSYVKNIFFTNLSINILAIIFTIALFLLMSKVFINSNKNSTKILVKVFIVFYIIIGGLCYFTESPEYVIEKNGKKMFAIVNDGPFQVSIDYYKDGNYFFYKRENLEFIEFYGGGSFDPIKNPKFNKVQGISYIKDNY